MDKTTIDTIRNLANVHKIEEAALLAVVEVESSGTPLWKVGSVMLPAIRWEGHYFYDRLTGAKLQEALAQGLANRKAGGVKNPKSYAARYELLERAKKIDSNAALESVSWGAGQVMGANWKSLGYKSVVDLVNAAQTIPGQIEMIVRFIVKNGLDKAIRNRDWLTFAKGYNGPKQKGYDKKIAEAYARYNGAPTSDYVVEDTAGVMQMQTMLNKLGAYGLTVDGDFGNATKAALRDFQLKNGLVSDGIYGPLTQEELEKDYKEASNRKEDILGKIIASGSGAGVAVSEAAKQIEPLAGASTWLQYLFIGLTVVGVLLTLKATIWK